MKKIIAAVFCIACLSVLHAQQIDSITQKLDAYLDAANRANKFNGNALITQKGKILLMKSYGYKNYTARVLNDSNTVFLIGSVTKQFTALVILKLQEEGKLSVHDKLDKYFPEFKYSNKITLENLLTHTSGMYDYVGDIDAEDSAISCHPVDKQMVLDRVFKHGLYFTPGTKFRYCNSGYYLLGQIIAKVTGKSYEQNVRDIIFMPLQMTHSFFGFSHSADTNIAKGYQHINSTGQEEAKAWRWDSTITYAAGGIFSTTGDMNKWAQAIVDQKILSGDSWKAMFTPHLEHYGYGLYIDSVWGKKSISHGGGLPGFISYLCCYINEDVTITLLNNYGWFGDALNGISADLSAIIFHKHYELMYAGEGKQFPIDSLKRYVGKYEFDKKHHAHITLENGQLHMEAPEGGLPKSPLFAEDQTNFYLKVINARIEFVKDASGNIIELIAHYNGKHEVCKKVK
jgi:CubicO group peptidase (beta-lactamase class C family)